MINDQAYQSNAYFFIYVYCDFDAQCWFILIKKIKLLLLLNDFLILLFNFGSYHWCVDRSLVVM